MTLYLNIMKAQGFYILLRLFPVSKNREVILSTRLYFHEPKDKCPCLNCLPPKRFTDLMKRNEYILISLINLFTNCTDMLCNHADVNRLSIVGHHCPISERVRLAMNVLQIDITQKQIQSWRKVFFPAILSSESSQVYTFDQFT